MVFCSMLLTTQLTVSFASETVWTPWISDVPISTIEAALPDDVATQAELEQIRRHTAEITGADADRSRYWNAGPANHRWMETLLKEIALGPPSPFKSRNIALLNVAIYDAVSIATNAKNQFKRERPTGISTTIAKPDTYSFPSARAAAASAASAVLAELYPENTDVYQKLRKEAASSRITAGVNYSSDVEAGLTIGDMVAEKVIKLAREDKSNTKFTGKRPNGAGHFKGEQFVYPAAGDWIGWFSDSYDHLLPPPPPELGSPELNAEIDALKAIKRPVPVAIQAWVNHSTYRAYQWWYERMAILSMERGDSIDLPEAALAYATLATASHDAILACFNAKYTYWMIRPAQLDSSIPTLFPNPPHPSYPAAHSCASRANAEVIGHYFPEIKADMDTAAETAGNSRLIAGIHYPSDKLAGDKIGRDVAATAIDFTARLRPTR